MGLVFGPLGRIENWEALKLLSVVENGALRKECYPFDG